MTKADSIDVTDEAHQAFRAKANELVDAWRVQQIDLREQVPAVA